MESDWIIMSKMESYRDQLEKELARRNNKTLLLADLCARIPYNVKADIIRIIQDDSKLLSQATVTPMFIAAKSKRIVDIKPYLRSLSRMTDEQRATFRNLGRVMSYNAQKDTYKKTAITPQGYDWLNANHYDYRGLIPLDLANEAPDDMYKTA